MKNFLPVIAGKKAFDTAGTIVSGIDRRKTMKLQSVCSREMAYLNMGISAVEVLASVVNGFNKRADLYAETEAYIKKSSQRLQEAGLIYQYRAECSSSMSLEMQEQFDQEFINRFK